MNGIGFELNLLKKFMKMNGTLEGGIAGATTLGLITETLKNIKGNSSHVNLFQRDNLRKRLKKTNKKNGFKATKQYLQLAEDMLGSLAYMGLSTLGKSKHTMLRGGVLGAAAGLGNVFLNGSRKKNEQNGSRNFNAQMHSNENKLSTQLLKVSLYAIGGLIAGRLVEDITKKNKKKKK